MNRAQRTIKDAGKLFGAQLSASLFAVFFSSWLARHLPSAELSLLPIAASLAGAVEVIAGLGFGDTFLRVVPSLIAQQRQSEAAAVLRTGLLLNMLLAALACAVLYTFATPIAHLLLKGQAGDSGPGLVRLLTMAVGFTASAKLLEMGLRAVQEFGKIATIRLMSTISRACLAVLFYMAMGVSGTIIAISLVPFAAMVLSVVWLWPHVRDGAEKAPPYALVKSSLPFYGASLANASTQRLDFLILGAITNPEKLAAYYVARQLADYLAYLNASVMDALSPKVGELGSRPKEELDRAFRLCTRYLFLGLLPAHVALALIGRPVVAIFAGGKYPEAGLIISVLSAALFVEVLSDLHRRFIIVTGRRWHLLATDSASGLVSPWVTAWLTMHIGGIGVAIAKLIVFVLQCILGRSLLSRVLTLRYDLGAALTAALGCLLAAGAYLAAVHLVGNIAGIIIGCLIGLGLYMTFIMLKISASDRELLRILQRR